MGLIDLGCIDCRGWGKNAKELEDEIERLQVERDEAVVMLRRLVHAVGEANSMVGLATDLLRRKFPQSTTRKSAEAAGKEGKG